MSKELEKARQDQFKVVLARLDKYLPKLVPKLIEPGRLAAVFQGEVRRNPKLLECVPASLWGSFLQASQLGLEVGPPVGHAYLVPFGKECTLIVGYKGMLELANRSNKLAAPIRSLVVYAGEHWVYKEGLHQVVEHTPGQMDRETLNNPASMVAAYSVITLKRGVPQAKVMRIEEVWARRRMSKQADSGPWVNHTAEMVLKTVIRQQFKTAPMSAEISRAVAVDETGESGEQVLDADVVSIQADLSDLAPVPGEEKPGERVSLGKSREPGGEG